MASRASAIMIKASVSVAMAALFLVVAVILGIGYPSSGGGLGSPNYNQNFGLPLTALYFHSVQLGPDTYTNQFAVIPLNLLIDFIIWSTPWYLLMQLFQARYDRVLDTK